MRMKSYAQQERHVEIRKKMELLGIQDVTTNRQHKNGTVVWRLPIKYSKDKFIEVASFKTGYVRNQNSGYSNYQINKRCESEPEYYQLANGNYRKYTTRTCKLIPNEIDRLEYLIAYCLKNYYIKNANQVINGDYVAKWTHEYEMNGLQNKLANSVPKWKYDQANSTYSENTGAMARINDMEEKLDAMTEDRDYKVQVLENKLSNAISATKHECTKQYSVKLEEKLYNLQNKLATIERIANDTNEWNG